MVIIWNYILMIHHPFGIGSIESAHPFIGDIEGENLLHFDQF